MSALGVIPGHMGKPSASEQQQVNTLMDRNGCHTCGTTNPGTKSGNAVVDHQRPQALGEANQFFPHCIDYMRRQGRRDSPGTNKAWEKMMKKIVLSPPNAILFVFDPANEDVVIPPYFDGELTAANNSCISVGIQADVDGETEVTLNFGSAEVGDLQRVYIGAISSPSGKVAVVTSQFQRLLEIDVSVGHVEVSVWADDDRNPGRVAVDVMPL